MPQPECYSRTNQPMRSAAGLPDSAHIRAYGARELLQSGLQKMYFITCSLSLSHSIAVLLDVCAKCVCTTAFRNVCIPVIWPVTTKYKCSPCISISLSLSLFNALSARRCHEQFPRSYEKLFFNDQTFGQRAIFPCHSHTCSNTNRPQFASSNPKPNEVRTSFSSSLMPMNAVAVHSAFVFVNGWLDGWMVCYGNGSEHGIPVCLSTRRGRRKCTTV